MSSHLIARIVRRVRRTLPGWTVEGELARLADEAGGDFGLAAIHVESGEAVSVNPEMPFQMASTVKVPLAVHVLRLVDRGEIALEEVVTLDPCDLRPGSGRLYPLLRVPGVALSVENLLRLSLIESDNTAADLLLGLGGGPRAVQATMTRLGLEGLTIDRSIRDVMNDLYGIGDLLPEGPYSVEGWYEARGSLSAPARRKAADAFLADARDTATPSGMARLLASLWRGDLLSDDSRSTLLSIMAGCATGPNRLRAHLPSSAVLAQKTGMLPGCITADTGILRLPDDGGHVAIAIFISRSDRPIGEQERTIADATRLAFDRLARRHRRARTR